MTDTAIVSFGDHGVVEFRITRTDTGRVETTYRCYADLADSFRRQAVAHARKLHDVTGWPFAVVEASGRTEEP